jgi:uncharacterized protein (TIGR02284 family)
MPDETLDIVEKLIETCRDGQAGYLEVAELARNTALKDFFSQQAMQRSRFAGELEGLAKRLGNLNPGRGPSLANTLHRAWIDLKHRMGSGDAGILDSVATGEENAKKYYRQALQADLPVEAHDLIERQAESVFMACDQVNALRSVYKNEYQSAA